MFRIALVSLALTGCVQKADFDALEARVKTAEEKVATLEKAPAGKAAPVAANPEAEEAASKLMTAVQEAVKAGDYPTAKAKLAELAVEPLASTRAGKASLLTTFPGDTTMATADQVRAFAHGGSARIQR